MALENEITVEEITQKVSDISSDFETVINSELKAKYMRWNIEAYNIITNRVKSKKGTFGTGYPFYVLDADLNGHIDTVITEQIRYNRALIEDGKVAKR